MIPNFRILLLHSRQTLKVFTQKKMTQVRWRVEDINENWKLQSINEMIFFFFKNSGLSLKNLRKFTFHDFCLCKELRRLGKGHESIFWSRLNLETIFLLSVRRLKYDPLKNCCVLMEIQGFVSLTRGTPHAFYTCIKFYFKEFLYEALYF